MKKILTIGLFSLICLTTLNASDKDNNAFSNEQRIDSFVNKIVEQKDDNLINQAKFDKEYLAYLRSKEAAKNKKNEAPQHKDATPINGLQTFNMSR